METKSGRRRFGWRSIAAAKTFVICVFVTPLVAYDCEQQFALYWTFVLGLIDLFYGIPEKSGADAAAEWVSNGPYGGPVRYGLTIDPNNPDTIYAASAGGVFKSSNGGLTWVRSNAGITDLSEIHSIAVDPTNSSIVYAGGVDQIDAIFKSVDGGVTWTPKADDLFESTVNAIAIDPTTPSTVYAGTPSGVWKSATGANSWTESSMGMADQDVVTIRIDHATPTTVYAMTRSRGIYKSTNGGGNWNPVNAGIATTGPNVQPGGTALAIDPATPATLYAGGYKSVNGGASWIPMSGLGPNVSSIVVDPHAPSTLYAGDTSGGVYKSTNGGGAWSPVNTGLTSLAVWGLALDPRGQSGVYSASDDGIFKSSDGGANWNAANSGLANTDVRAVVIDPSAPGTVYAGTTSNGLFKTVDGGGTWMRSYRDARVTAMAIDPQAPATVYAANYHGAVLKTTNGGGLWTSNAGLPNAVISLAIDPQHPATLYAGTGGNGLFKSTNGGVNWLSSGVGIPATAIINSITVSPTNGSLWAFVQIGARGFATYISVDAGASWSTSYPGWGPSLSNGVATLSFLSQTAGLKSVVADLVAPQYPDLEHCLPVLHVVTDPNEAGLGYVAGVCGVGRGKVENNALKPRPFSARLPAQIVANTIAITPSGSDLYAGLQWGGVHRLTLIEQPSATVVEYHLENPDHYFITADPVEQAAVDGGAAGPFTRTGGTFKAGGSTPVCRFFGNTNINPATGGFYGPTSHFYTSDAAECAGLKAAFVANAKAWKFESNDFLTTPAVNGVCPANLAPIYRAYNNGFAQGVDSNHRITGDAAAYQAQVAKGWIGEGVVMCAPK